MSSVHFSTIFTSINEEFTDKEWKKLERLKKEKGKVFKNSRFFLKHLKAMVKK